MYPPVTIHKYTGLTDNGILENLASASAIKVLHFIVMSILSEIVINTHHETGLAV